jgi:hypothetical protein
VLLLTQQAPGSDMLEATCEMGLWSLS